MISLCNSDCKHYGYYSCEFKDFGYKYEAKTREELEAQCPYHIKEKTSVQKFFRPENKFKW